ncbi:MmgE/PrpD family protein [Amycolatopsis rhabdoformis]|uniref:MmgE/PrpD family protein n=1 Tax=Amycolatopsis rhabdoformis TaxID=1448059 RepID=A0ABZ1IE24_9PSEU|nr:MmgE/PrpD family protein [Amycolatopsis rhabdoformis]WSE31908.1 MmgE/PrpD family protein [Amycolatopsis rhabdoformis]
MTTLEHTAAPTDPAGTTGVVAGWLAGLELDAVPERVIGRAAHLTLDGVGCALIGAQLPWSRAATEVVLQLEGTGPATVAGWGRSTTAPAAALLNGTFIQGFELDDYHPLGPLHSASVVLPAALAAAEHTKATTGRVTTGAELLRALIAGYELGPRVGMALHGGDLISRGWHSGSVFGTLAAAAAAGCVLRLSPAGFEDALGLAATQSSGLMAAQYEAMCKRMHHGFSARAGVYSAALAAGGFTGIKRVLERDYGGYLSTFGLGGKPPDPAAITATLGRDWEIERISIKPYAAQGGTHAAIDAIAAIRRRRPLDPARVAEIRLAVGHTVYHHGVWDLRRPMNEITAQMSLAYGTAVALLDGTVMVEQFLPPRINRDDVWDLMRRVSVRHDPTIDALGPTARLRTEVDIVFTDGTVEREVVDTPSGGLDHPLPDDAITAKFATVTASVLDADRRAAIRAGVLGLRELPDVGELIGLLAPPVPSALESVPG